jgi:hypothetical protein
MRNQRNDFLHRSLRKKIKIQVTKRFKKIRRRTETISGILYRTYGKSGRSLCYESDSECDEHNNEILFLVFESFPQVTETQETVDRHHDDCS